MREDGGDWRRRRHRTRNGAREADSMLMAIINDWPGWRQGGRGHHGKEGDVEKGPNEVCLK